MMNTMENKGIKNDYKDDKTRWDLLPLDCLEDVARLYTEGAKKYGDNNWQSLDNGYERYKGALLRHLYKSTYEEFDEETKVRHEAAVCWNALAMLWIRKHYNYNIALQKDKEDEQYRTKARSNTSKSRSNSNISESNIK